MNILINKCKLPILKKNFIYKISIGHLFLDNFLLEKNYVFPQKKSQKNPQKTIIQSHLVGNLGDLVIIHNKKVVIEGYFKVFNNIGQSEIKFYNLEDQDKLKGIFPAIDENSFNFTHKKINLFFH